VQLGIHRQPLRQRQRVGDGALRQRGVLEGVDVLAVGLPQRLPRLARGGAGVAGRVGAQEWRAALDRVPRPASPRDAAPALIAGVRAIATLLAAKGFRGGGSDRNELPDRPREETGP
jgi:hypothetical protein